MKAEEARKLQNEYVSTDPDLREALAQIERNAKRGFGYTAFNVFQFRDQVKLIKTLEGLDYKVAGYGSLAPEYFTVHWESNES